MGEKNVSGTDQARLRSFIRTLLDDVHALERMIDGGLIESGVRRIGAEQEMFLVDEAFEPAPVAPELLANVTDPRFTTEVARYNLEANIEPLELGGDCLRRIEEQLDDAVGVAQKAAEQCGAQVLLTGILPTLQVRHLTLENMTPMPRYFALNNALRELRGDKFSTYIKGLDELQLQHDNVMLESCNTSFQIHFQVGPEEFPTLYNLAQLVTAPVLAAAVNSPMLLRHRLWHETRVALFQQSVDSRSRAMTARGQRTRVNFGERWLDESVLEIFREDIARFRVLLASDIQEKSGAMLDRGEMPPLTAMQIHNGTVYRWNRPCYGVHNGVAHLRIENRVLPSGPTVLDEMANAAFYFGLMVAIGEEVGDVRKAMSFDEAKANFFAAARYGMKARLTWIDGRAHSADELIRMQLLPIAREGLRERGIDQKDIDRYLDVIEQRVSTGRTGAQWMLDSLQNMGARRTVDERCRSLTAAIKARQSTGEPVHAWTLATLEESSAWRHSYRTIGQVMNTDLFTVRPEDSVDLTASLMTWEHIRHVPVENEGGELVGIVSHRQLLRLLARGRTEPVAVSEIMTPDPVCVAPDCGVLEAIETMKRHRVSALPVVEDNRLVGIVTDADFMEVALELMKQHLP